MFFDYTSLLLATGVTALAGAMTFLLSWTSDRSGGFLISCGIAMLGVGISTTGFLHFSATENILSGYLACSTLVIALVVALGSARQYQTNHFPRTSALILSALVLISLTIAFTFGLTGLGFALANLASALLLIACAVVYWKSRTENPTIVSTLSALYGICGLSFLACTAMLLIETPLRLNGPPNNWAESLNLLASAVCLTGVAALTIALNHQRLVRSHRQASQTDPLTGLNNRRALFDKFGDDGLPPDTSIILCDLDRFKRVNDQHGHATGDAFLVAFASICAAKLRPTDFAVRLGGEEFAIIVADASASLALAMAESVRMAFEKLEITSGAQSVSCTLSCGVFANETSASTGLGQAMSLADVALYQAKSRGRNLVLLANEISTEQEDGAVLRSRAIAKVRKAN